MNRVFVSGSAALAVMALGYYFLAGNSEIAPVSSESSYEQCILDNMGAAGDRLAASEIRAACRSLNTINVDEYLNSDMSWEEFVNGGN